MMYFVARISLAIVLTSSFGMKSTYAGMPAPFHIELNGRSMFVGDTDQPGNSSYTEILESQLAVTSIELSKDSQFRGNKTGDVILNGTIDFQIGDLPKMRLQSLRLIYFEEDEPDQSRSANRWKIHPDDASLITAYYEKIEGPTYLLRERRQQQFELFLNWLPICVYGATVVSLLIFVFLRRRKTRIELVDIDVSANPPVVR